MVNDEHDAPVIEEVIAGHLSENGATIRNKAAFGTLLKLLPRGDALHHALTAGDNAIKEEKIQLQLDLLCQLVQKIDQAISEMLDESNAKDAGFVEVNGQITVRGEATESITGLDVSSGRSTTIKPGTVVDVDGSARNITGVKI